ncbi:MAG TPA: TonB-dependent receptor, partial [Novosphingobium sp.]|nr:TonB-dependent receptor [Novosphingobium sp.]
MRIIGKLALASVSFVTLAGVAQAQSASDSGFSSEDIIVQARRKDESAQDVPLVVQAVTAQDLEKLNIRDFKDVQSLVPGL